MDLFPEPLGYLSCISALLLWRPVSLPAISDGPMNIDSMDLSDMAVDRNARTVLYAGRGGWYRCCRICCAFRLWYADDYSLSKGINEYIISSKIK